MLQKLPQKQQLKKTEQASGYLIPNKITDKITSIGKSKEHDKTKKVEEIYVPPEKSQLIRMTWDCFSTKFLLYKNGVSKNCKFARYDFWW